LIAIFLIFFLIYFIFQFNPSLFSIIYFLYHIWSLFFILQFHLTLDD